MADFMEGLESPEELMEKQRAYDEQKRKAAIYGSIADNLSNRQSLGSIMLGRNVGGFTPSKAVEAGFGPSGAAPDEAYKQRLSGLLTRSQLAKAQRDEASEAKKMAQSETDATQLGKLQSGLGKKYGLGPSEGLSMEGQKQYKELLEKVMQAKERSALSKIMQGNSLTQKQPSAEEFKAAGFSKQMEQAEADLDGILGEGVYDPTSTMSSFELSNWTPNKLKPDGAKQYQQAASRFITANLRKESGASISKDEFAREYDKYFPLPGDGEDVLAQKKAARLQAIENLKGEGGRAYDRIKTVAAVPKSKKQRDMDLIKEAAAGMPKFDIVDEDLMALEYYKANPDAPEAPALRAKLARKGLLK